MSRYRPPGAPKGAYITKEGADKLLAELKYLWKEKRPEVTQSVSDAAKLGDRSENAEGRKEPQLIYSSLNYP